MPASKNTKERESTRQKIKKSKWLEDKKAKKGNHREGTVMQEEDSCTGLL